MIEQIINYIGNTALKHKAVNTFSYKSRVLINAQNDNSYMKFVIEDNTYFQNLITQNIFTATMNIDILGQPNDDSEILAIQNDAFQIAVEVMAYIEQDTTFMGQLSIHDYDILFVSHFTDDDSAGVRLSLEVVVPNPINLCEYQDNFDENKVIEEKKTVDLTSAKKTEDTKKKKELHLKPIKLKTNNG